jgi:hypothetical protein
MSTLIWGTTECPLCETVIHENQESIQLPAFTWDRQDPLLIFNDSALHKSCFSQSPQCKEVEQVLDDLNSMTGPGNRKCAVCQNEITDPDDYLLIPRMVSDGMHSLFKFRYTHLHKSHVRLWGPLAEVLSLLNQLASDDEKHLAKRIGDSSWRFH